MDVGEYTIVDWPAGSQCTEPSGAGKTKGIGVHGKTKGNTKGAQKHSAMDSTPGASEGHEPVLNASANAPPAPALAQATANASTLPAPAANAITSPAPVLKASADATPAPALAQATANASTSPAPVPKAGADAPPAPTLGISYDEGSLGLSDVFSEPRPLPMWHGTRCCQLGWPSRVRL